MSASPVKSLYDSAWLQLGIGLAVALLVFRMQMTTNPVIILGFAAAPIVLLAAFRNPYLAAILFMGFSFFRIHEAYPAIAPLRLIFATSVLSLAVLIWHAMIARSFKPVWTPELTFLFLFFLHMTIGIGFAFNPDLAFAFWSGNYVKIVVMVPAIAWMIRTADDFSWTNRIIVIGGMLIAARAIYNKIYGIGLVEGTRVTIGRPETESPFDLGDPSAPTDFLFDDDATRAILSDPNDLALVLLFPLGFALALLIYRASPTNVLLGLLGTPMMVLGLIATQSRGGLIGILTVFGIFGLRLVKSKILLGLLGLLAFVVLFVAMGIGDRQSGGFDELSSSGIDESAMGRIIAWQAALNMALNRPLFGVGLDNFVDSFSTYTLIWPGMNKAPHSTWFGVLGEAGMVGFLLFLTLLILTIRTALKDFWIIGASEAPPIMKGTALALIASLASFCTAGTFLTQGFTWPLYILIALTIAQHQFTRQYAALANGHSASLSIEKRPTTST